MWLVGRRRGWVWYLGMDGPDVVGFSILVLDFVVVSGWLVVAVAEEAGDVFARLVHSLHC